MRTPHGDGVILGRSSTYIGIRNTETINHYYVMINGQGLLSIPPEQVRLHEEHHDE